ncbi:type II toxin-antitoxin system RelE/ParE family toxin [Sandarakinorhabdus sp. DWP1-3-1]|uniref:type II toxin-antitoxin system RelE/ParE family toxin n=1 Tax=Sandarakinorhabdus sp. DWP1-3-1 TaxID=2804627 RepID=UPI003CF93A0C
MTSVVWSAAARRQLYLITAWIARHDAGAASRLADAIDDRIALLCDFPALGTPIDRGHRKLSLGRFPYVLVYAVSGDVIQILAIRHMARSAI